MTTIDAIRLAQINATSLKVGAHREAVYGDSFNVSVMEAVAYIAGEPWSEKPQCACPVITVFMAIWSLGLQTSADRDRLFKPLIPLIVGTRSTKDVEEKRSYIALDWLVRVHTPGFLDLLPGLTEHAKALRDMDAIVDMASAIPAAYKVHFARTAAYEFGVGAWKKSDAASRDAAGDGGKSAARAALKVTSGIPSVNDAIDAARAAAWCAAWSGTGDVLKPTTEWLQVSAVGLVRQMIETTD